MVLIEIPSQPIALYFRRQKQAVNSPKKGSAFLYVTLIISDCCVLVGVIKTGRTVLTLSRGRALLAE